MKDSEKWRALLANDRGCDGRFYYGVKSTGIYCRPSCPSKAPKRENVVFFDSAEEAVNRGFRPCKRCRPELLEFDPAAELAAEARTIIDRSYADRQLLREKLNSIGVTRRHLTEVFEREYGLSPEQYAAQARYDRARALLDAGNRITDTAFSVGMGSAASFATFFKKQSGLSPTEYVARRIAERPHRLFQTPLGPMRIEEDRQGITSLRFEGSPAGAAGTNPAGLYLRDAEAQLSEYFAGKRRAFDLPLSISGTDFQKRVWNALQGIPYGETRSYQAVADAIGNPKAARAVGMANNRNPIMILIPCHRVVGKSGQLVGYAGGIERKQCLLTLEAQVMQRAGHQ